MHDLRMIGLELRGMASTGHLLRIPPLALLASLLSLWPYIGSPFAPAAVATMLALEPFYNNTLDLWRGQLTADVVLPIDVARTLRRKNIALILLTWACASVFVILVCYVQPEPPLLPHVLSFVFYLATVQFPLLMLGNSISWQQIRPRSRWTLEDAAAGILMVIGGGVVSLPWLLLTGLSGDGIIFIVYTAAMGSIWWSYAIPRTAHIIHERQAELWQQIHLT
jgi:hypothetical protein